MPTSKTVEPATDVNALLMKQLDLIDQQEFTLGQDNEATDAFPDAAITFNSFNSSQLGVKIQLNDLRISEYHRNNGFTKSSFKLDFLDLGNLTKVMKKFKSRMREVYLDQNMTIPTLRVTEGLLNI